MRRIVFLIFLVLFLVTLASCSNTISKEDYDIMKQELEEIKTSKSNMDDISEDKEMLPATTPVVVNEDIVKQPALDIMEGSDNNLVDKTYSFTAGNYLIGRDIPAGIYDMAWISGDGICTLTKNGENNNSEVFGDSDNYIKLFKNAVLNDDGVIEVGGNLKLQFVPVASDVLVEEETSQKSDTSNVLLFKNFYQKLNDSLYNNYGYEIRKNSKQNGSFDLYIEGKLTSNIFFFIYKLNESNELDSIKYDNDEVAGFLISGIVTDDETLKIANNIYHVVANTFNNKITKETANKSFAALLEKESVVFYDLDITYYELTDDDIFLVMFKIRD